MGGLARDLFFEDDTIWHQQPLGKPGLIATANVIIQGNRLYGLAYRSDLLQRISRRSEHRDRVEECFGGWHWMLLNSILSLATELGLREVWSPTADLASRHTDPNRSPERDFFTRIYDRPGAEASGG